VKECKELEKPIKDPRNHVVYSDQSKNPPDNPWSYMVEIELKEIPILDPGSHVVWNDQRNTPPLELKSFMVYIKQRETFKGPWESCSME
jgi:hypothetical protein